ncbi:class I SAM-dependent methyltransferase [Magnetospirillum molischianum]|uniref:Methylase involved in ubiquinone/menaquinone biosynthesis-like n=1 Tax=Magnetospirillum molischianum DSM 120 TaxID=1150626 RepID=H8FS19_MAGML|nr:class I SAM-dependent methyltransferase [Magnetospirillum molischianum]CCG41157.1 Methylase involved in ubiquinone/menaquinone biosynthesis-like [Magnetospirillum molischianum DSM 120]
MTEISNRIDAVWGDPAAWEAAGWQWERLPEIRRMVNRHVTGDEAIDPLGWFFRRVARERPLPLGRALVLACGSGGLELRLIGEGMVREIVAVDLSPRSLEVARATARQSGVTGIEYRCCDMNALDVAGPFDLVIGSSALHHCENLEGIFDAIRRILVPGGWFFLNDYVGPNRLQYDAAQVMQVNRLLQLLPDHLVVNEAGFSRRGFRRAPVAEVVAFDPSEAPRSADILRVMRQSLAVETVRPYGGNLLYLTLSNLAQNFDVEHSGDAVALDYLKLLIEASDHWRVTRPGQDHFAVAVARQPIS